MTFRRCNLSVSPGVYDALQRVAERRGVTVVTLIRAFLKVGLLAVAIEEEGGLVVLSGADGIERRLVLP